MELSVRSQIWQFAERFFHQSGFFKIYHGTRYSMDEFFSPRSEIKLYEENKNQMNQNSIHNWR
jgi:hypothetical protein